MSHAHQTHDEALAQDRAQYQQADGTYRITGTEIIGDLVVAFPKSAAIMLRHGLHCVGCSANAFDTVADGARLHGIPEGEIMEMIDEINTALNKRIETLEITQKAIAKVKELRAKEDGKADWPLRVRVHTGSCGCSFTYEMDFDHPSPDDLRLEFDGLAILVDPASIPLLKGSSIEYVETAGGAGFRIENPNAGNGCGCGSHEN